MSASRRPTNFHAEPSTTSFTTTTTSEASVSRFVRLGRFLHGNRLGLYDLLAVLLALVVGFALIGVHDYAPTPRQLQLMGFVGELYTRALKTFAMVYLCSGTLVALSRLLLYRIAYIGIRGVGFFCVTSLLASVTALTFALMITPGLEVTLDIDEKQADKYMTFQDVVFDTWRNLVPDNIVKAGLIRGYTKLEPLDEHGNRLPLNERKYETDVWDTRANSAGMIFFFAVLGVCVGMTKNTHILDDLFDSFNIVASVCVNVIVWFSPFALFSSTLLAVVEIPKLSDLYPLADYAVTVIVSCLVHSFVVLPLVYFFIFRRLPFRLYFDSIEAMSTAFATRSSLAALPVSMRCMEKHGVRRVVYMYILPISVTFQMNGSVIFGIVRTLFVAQALGHSYTNPVNLFLVVTASIFYSTTEDFAETPAVIIPFRILNLTAAVGDVVDIVDSTLDCFVTVANLLGDLVAVAILEKLSRLIFVPESERGNVF